MPRCRLPLRYRTLVFLAISFALYIFGHPQSTNEARKQERVVIPPSLTVLAKTLLGDSYRDVVSRMEPPSAISCLGKTVLLTENGGDDSIQRLEVEFASLDKDTYGIHKISSSHPLVLDIGGNIGFISILTQLVHPRSQIVVFEPSPLTYFFLRLNLFINQVHVLTSEELQGNPHTPGIYPVFGGLGASQALEYARMSDPERVKHQSQNGIVDFGEVGDIPMYSLPSFLLTHGLSDRPFDIVKLDCECCEYRVIPNSSDWLLNRALVVSLTGEIHGCGHVGVQSEATTLKILKKRGCNFPEANFLDGRFRETANLHDNCID